MTFQDKLNQAISRNNSLVCVGLDPDPDKLPEHLSASDNPVLAFSRAIIDATSDLVCAYKPNFAFYGSLGERGWPTLTATLSHIPPYIPVIIDAKVGDIGSSAEMYARMLLDQLGADAITVNPYMGEDAVAPFLQRADKGVFLLCLTSNRGADDFEKQSLEDGSRLYERVARKSLEWNRNGNCGLVVGATQPESVRAIRSIAPNLPLLMPGVGAQGGEVEATVGLGLDSAGGGLIINASRSIIYAGSDTGFAESARRAATELRDQINPFRNAAVPA